MSSIHFEHPEAWYLLLLLIPAIITCCVQYRKLESTLMLFSTGDPNRKNKIRRKIVYRTVCWCLAWVCFTGALSDPYWGTKLVSVQKFGKSASFVFDISYSMMADDVPAGSGSTRLEAAGNFASALLDRMDGASVSAVLAKGSGITAVPVTEDFNAIRTLLDYLEPGLMTSAGTSLGSGITAAAASFPETAAKQSTIILFTDGDETDGSLEESVVEVVRKGISVIMVGFGSETGTDIVAGDGVTEVKTMLRSEKLKSIAERVSDSVGKENAVLYVDSNQSMALSKVYKAVMSSSDTVQTGYEIQSVGHFLLMMMLSLGFFFLGFILSEFTLRRSSILMLVMMISAPGLFTGCSGRFSTGAEVLASTVRWHQKNYVDATSGFLQVTEDYPGTEVGEEVLSAEEGAESAADEKPVDGEDDYLRQYGLFGLSSTYIMQNENDAALERINQISEGAPDDIRFAALYNTGIIAHRKGEYEAAAEAFKQALMLDGSSLDAKINLELSLMKQSVTTAQTETSVEADSSSADVSPRQDLIFSLVKENEKNRWKNTDVQDANTAVIDY